MSKFKKVEEVPLLGDDLTKEKAIDLLHKGYTVRHRYFDVDEYMDMPWGGVFRLSGKHIIHQSVFWEDRKGDHWETGWEIVNQ